MSTKMKSFEGRTKPSPKGKTNKVFISAPINIDTRPIRKAFEERNMKCFSLDEIDLAGRSVMDMINDGISKADVVVAVVDPTSASNFVFFEMGYAINMGKPTAVLLIGKETSPFWVSTGIPYFRYSPENPIGIDFIVQQILSIPQHRQSPPISAKETRPLGENANAYLAYLDKIDSAIGEPELTLIVSKAIQESGVSSVSADVYEIHYLDLAVWSDDFVPWVGNPLAIKLRRELRSASHVHQTTKRMTQQMKQGGFSFGMLIYLHAGVEVESMIASPFIAAISVRQLFESLRTSSFGDIVRHLRNQRVHGAA